MNAAPLTPLRDFSDRLSPMVVKELRHGLRTRAFTSILTFFQLIMILIIGAGMMGVPMEVVNNIFWSISLLALLLALPLRGFATLSGETQAGTMDMLTLTSISSFRIVWGKWSALFSQTLLLSTSLLPYMVARYHFGGVEIVREVIALTVAALASGLASAAYVAFSSQRSLILRLFLTAGVLGSLLPVTVFIFVMINDTSGDEVLRELLSLPRVEQIGIVGGILLMVIYGIVTLLAMGASRIAPVSENHSTWKRVVHLGMIGLLAVAGGALSFHSEEAAAVWIFVPAMFMTLIIGLDVLTEEMPRFPSVVQGFMQRGAFTRRTGRLLYPGWASGTFLYLLLCSLILSVMVIHASRHSWNDVEEKFGVFFCILAAAALPLCLRINRHNRFANWWIVHIGLGVSGILLTFFVDLSNMNEVAFVGVLTPITGLLASTETYSSREELLLMTCIFSLCWLLTALYLAWKENSVYTRLEAEAQDLSATSQATKS